MCNVSVIVTISDCEMGIECLDSILNQSLENIEIICITNGNDVSIFNNSSKYNRIKFISTIDSLFEVQGEYVIYINNVISNEIFEMLYSYSKSFDLDVLYVPNYDCFIEKNKNNENLQITPVNFTKFFKKEFFNIEFDDSNMKYNFDFFDKSLYFKNYVNCFNLGANISEILSRGDVSKNNYLFVLLIKYLNYVPLNCKQEVYELIRKKFNNIDLNEKNHLICSLILKNKYYLDFDSELKLENTDYEVYGNYSKDNHYKISVVIPIYNNENLIHRTLMSIENQSFNIENIEVLMINDASTDNTSKVLNMYADKYSNFVAVHIKNGSGSAGTPRNIGLKLASAKYVMFLDHDDFFEIDALKKLYFFITNYKCDIVFGTYVLVNGDTPIKFVYPNQKQGFFNSLLENKELLSIPPSIWTKLFNKDFLLENNILFPTILGEDAIFMSKVFNNANGIYYSGNEIICYYNLNENSYTNNASYNYFVEGFMSETYLFNLYCDWNHNEFYYFRGDGILNYYINRFMDSDLDNDEIEELMPLFYEFCYRFALLNISLKNERNAVIFNYVLKKDLNGLIKFKNYKPNKIKDISNKFLTKINKHRFW